MSFRDRIQSGLDGHYVGLDNGLDRINSYIFGWQRACYLLLGGMSGSAKTTLLDYMLLSAIADAEKKNIPINIFYYCLEINEETKKANWLSVIIYKKYQKVIPPEKIKGLGNQRLSEEELAMVDECLPILESYWSKINWTFTAINPTGVYNNMWKFMKERGKFEYETYTDEYGNEKKKIVRFIPDNPHEYNFLVGDHIKLLAFERGFTLKENIDKMSEYSVVLRNLFKLTICWVQQFNQAMSNIDRIKYSGVNIEPSQSDFMDSSVTYADADIAIGLLNAYKMQLPECLGYDINKTSRGLKHRFRMLKIIKNRLSRDDITIGLLFHPEAGRFKELPKISEMTNEIYESINRL